MTESILFRISYFIEIVSGVEYVETGFKEGTKWCEWEWYYDAPPSQIPALTPIITSTPKSTSFESSTPATYCAAGKNKGQLGKPPLSKKVGKKSDSLVSSGTPMAPTPTPLKPTSSRKSADFRTPSVGRTSSNGESPMARYPKHLSPADVDSKTISAADRGESVTSGRKIKRVSHDDEVPFRQKKMKIKGVNATAANAANTVTITETQEPIKRQLTNIQYDLPRVPSDTSFNLSAAAAAANSTAGHIGVMESYVDKLNKELLQDVSKKLRPPIPPYIPTGKPIQISHAVVV